MDRFMSRALLVAALVASACSKSDKTELPSGTVLGKAFTPVEAVAVFASVASCQLEGGSLNVSNLSLAFRDAAGLCTTAAHPCVGKPNARTVGVLLMTQGASAQQPIGPGRYDVVLDGSGLKPNANGTFVYGIGLSVQTDATCAESAPPTQGSGTVELSSVGTGSVRGTIDLTFADGGKFAGPFEASVCGTHPTACDAMSSTCEGLRTCQ